MNERFPQWADNIEYWLVHDIDKTSVLEALEQIEKHPLRKLFWKIEQKLSKKRSGFDLESEQQVKTNYS